jgi:Apea-like HEPN
LELTASLGPATGVLFGTLSSRMYVSSQIVVLASAAEAYHRTIDDNVPVAASVHEQVTQAVLHGLHDDADRSFYDRALRYVNQLSQEQRIVALTKRAATVVAPLGNKPGRLGQRITATRNALVHLPAAPRDVLEGWDLIEAVELLVLVFHANLLLGLGLAPEHAGDLLTRSYGRQRFWQNLHHRNCSWPKRG